MNVGAEAARTTTLLAMEATVVVLRGHEVGMTGDGFLATFDGPARAIRCARGIRDAVHSLGLDIRAAVHTGECERIDATIAGIAVHTGARVMAEAGPGEIFYPISGGDLRRTQVRRFPHSVFFSVEPDPVAFLAVVHGHRHSRTWPTCRR